MWEDYSVRVGNAFTATSQPQPAGVPYQALMKPIPIAPRNNPSLQV